MSETRSIPLEGQRVLVTGATGFIGGRLVEKLILHQKAEVRALVRKYGHAARIARFDLEMPGGSIEDAAAVDNAVTGVDVAFNLAYLQTNSVAENVEAINNLIDSCLRHEVRRLVHISTYSVYEPFSDGVIDADTPVGPGPYGYPQAKIAVEQEIVDAVRERGLDAVILRPTIVYGPFGGYWTDRPVKNLIKGRVVLPDDGSGICNGVFVDDLVDAMVLAATRPAITGETFLISGPDHVTWKTFYETIQQCIGVETLRFMDRPSAAQRDSSPRPTAPVDARPPGLKSKARSGIGSLLSKEQKRQLRRALRRLKRGTQNQGISTDYDYSAKPVCRIDKARQLLGYDPKFDFQAGMAVTCEYLRWAYPQTPAGAEGR